MSGLFEAKRSLAIMLSACLAMLASHAPARAQTPTSLPATVNTFIGTQDEGKPLVLDNVCCG